MGTIVEMPIAVSWTLCIAVIALAGAVVGLLLARMMAPKPRTETKNIQSAQHRPPPAREPAYYEDERPYRGMGSRIPVSHGDDIESNRGLRREVLPPRAAQPEPRYQEDERPESPRDGSRPKPAKQPMDAQTYDTLANMIDAAVIEMSGATAKDDVRGYIDSRRDIIEKFQRILETRGVRTGGSQSDEATNIAAASLQQTPRPVRRPARPATRIVEDVDSVGGEDDNPDQERGGGDRRIR
jgi:hypothetical protein